MVRMPIPLQSRVRNSSLFGYSTKPYVPEQLRLTVTNAVNNYLSVRKADKLRESTLNLYKIILTNFQQIIGPNRPVESITALDIDKYKQLVSPQVATATINMHLRTIKTFLRWLYESHQIPGLPKIRQIKKSRGLPIYLSNKEFKEILKHVPRHYQRTFWFYRETGCRLSEPFIGTLNGDFLTIDATTAKGNHIHELYLSPSLQTILQEMRAHINHRNGKQHNLIKIYSKRFKKACEEAQINGKKFHSLRHTFAVRLYLKTRDIYYVSKRLGHSSVVTTEIYAKFNIRRLAQDFPDLVENIDSLETRTE